MVDGSRIEIAPRFNGPADSGQGGYSCGMVAGVVGNPAEVTLRKPVPLGRPLDAPRDADGSVQVRDGETLIAEGRPIEPLDLEPPAAPNPEQAREASRRYESKQEQFANCFVCGPARRDGQNVFAGPVPGRQLVASPWTPSDEFLDADGVVRGEFVWAVLDCPTYFAIALERPDMAAWLGRQSAQLLAPVRMGERHVIFSWPMGSEGRKHSAGCAIASQEGKVLAVSRGTWVEISEAPAPAAPSASP